MVLIVSSYIDNAMCSTILAKKTKHPVGRQELDSFNRLPSSLAAMSVVGRFQRIDGS